MNRTDVMANMNGKTITNTKHNTNAFNNTKSSPLKKTLRQYELQSRSDIEHQVLWNGMHILKSASGGTIFTHC